MGVNSPVTSRKMTEEEANKYGVSKDKVRVVEWFIDVMAPQLPVVSFNTTGIKFNRAAAQEIGDKPTLKVGIWENRLIFKADPHGLRRKTLKLNGQQNGFMITNQKLLVWIKEKGIEAKRYELKRDDSFDEYYVELS